MARSSEKLKDTFAEYTNITTIHGLKQLNGVKALRKLIWLLLLIGCSVLLIVQIRMKLSLYYQDPIITNIEYEYPPSASFPAVMICNDNLFRISYTKDNLYHLISEIYEPGGTANLSKQINFTMFQDELEEARTKSSLWFLQTASSHLSQMLISCITPDNHQCTVADFKEIPTTFGSCYAINIDNHKPMKVKSEGSSNGLYLLLNIEAYERMPGSVNTLGLKLLVYNQTAMAMPALEGINVPPGYETSIALNKRIRYKIPLGKGGSCIKEKQLKYFRKSTHYDSNRCKVNMVVDQVINNCNCSPFFLPHPELPITKTIAPPICNIENHFRCVVYANKIPKDASTCRDSCTTVTYTTDLSMTKLPTGFLVQKIGSEETDKIYKRFLYSNEVRQRVQRNKMEANRLLVYNMRAAAAQLKNLHMAPLLSNYIPTYKRLQTDVPCFKAFLANYTEVLLKNGVWISEEQPFHYLLHSEKILSIIHPEIKLETLILHQAAIEKSYREELGALRMRLRRVIDSLAVLLSIFRKSTYRGELGSDSEHFGEYMHLLEEYESGNITKLQWAVRASRLSDTLSDYTGGVLYTMHGNVVSNLRQNIKSLEFENASETIQEMLSDPILLELSTQLLFQDYQNESCVSDMTDLTNELYNKYKNMDPYPDLLDHEDRITALCPVIPPVNLKAALNALKSCTFGPLLDESYKLEKLVTRASDIIREPFGDLTEELRAYEWKMKQATQFFDENILAVNIFFKDLSIEKIIHEHAYDIWSLLCDIGGTLGLFLGASLVTLYEIFDFFILGPICKAANSERTQNGAVAVAEDNV